MALDSPLFLIIFMHSVLRKNRYLSFNEIKNMGSQLWRHQIGVRLKHNEIVLRHESEPPTSSASGTGLSPDFGQWYTFFVEIHSMDVITYNKRFGFCLKTIARVRYQKTCLSTSNLICYALHKHMALDCPLFLIILMHSVLRENRYPSFSEIKNMGSQLWRHRTGVTLKHSWAAALKWTSYF